MRAAGRVGVRKGKAIVIFSDNFNRSDRVVESPPYISGSTGNIVNSVLTSSSGMQYVNIPYDNGNLDVQMDVGSSSSGLYVIPGNGAAAAFVFDPAGFVQFRSRVDNSVLYQASSGVTTSATVRCTIVGNVYNYYVNGVLKLSNDFGTHTRSGGYLYIALYTDMSVDNLLFSVGYAA